MKSGSFMNQIQSGTLRHDLGPSGRNTLSGFSVAEVMFAMTIFAIGALGTTMLLLHSYRSSNNAVYSTTAHSVAQGYVEQIMALDYATVMTAYRGRNDPNPAVLNLKALSPSVSGAASIEMRDPLDFSGSWIEKEIVVDIRSDSSGSTNVVSMPMRITLKGRDLTTAPSPLIALEVSLDYEYWSPSVREGKWVSGKIAFVKSTVPIY